MGADALPPTLGLAVQNVALQQNRLTGVLSITLERLAADVFCNLASSWA